MFYSTKSVLNYDQKWLSEKEFTLQLHGFMQTIPRLIWFPVHSKFNLFHRKLKHVGCIDINWVTYLNSKKFKLSFLHAFSGLNTHILVHIFIHTHLLWWLEPPIINLPHLHEIDFYVADNFTTIWGPANENQWNIKLRIFLL